MDKTTGLSRGAKRSQRKCRGKNRCGCLQVRYAAAGSRLHALRAASVGRHLPGRAKSLCASSALTPTVRFPSMDARRDRPRRRYQCVLCGMKHVQQVK
jgi:hypothetical protein